MPVRREQVAAALKYLGDKADVKRRYERLTSLDQPQDSDAIDMALEMGGSLVPGVGPALAARDFERARRADDKAGMAMAGVSALPLGKLVGALRGYDPAMQKIISEKLYHGSPDPNLKELDPRKAMEVRGTTWFSDNPDVASDYIYPREYGELLLDEPAGKVYQAAVSIKNPLVVDFAGEVGDAVKLSKLAERAKKEGYDGLVIRNVDDTVGSTKVLGTSYAVFDKNQIKLLDEK